MDEIKKFRDPELDQIRRKTGSKNKGTLKLVSYSRGEGQGRPSTFAYDNYSINEDISDGKDNWNLTAINPKQHWTKAKWLRKFRWPSRHSDDNNDDEHKEQVCHCPRQTCNGQRSIIVLALVLCIIAVAVATPLLIVFLSRKENKVTVGRIKLELTLANRYQPGMENSTSTMFQSTETELCTEVEQAFTTSGYFPDDTILSCSLESLKNGSIIAELGFNISSQHTIPDDDKSVQAIMFFVGDSGKLGSFTLASIRVVSASATEEVELMSTVETNLEPNLTQSNNQTNPERITTSVTLGSAATPTAVVSKAATTTSPASTSTTQMQTTTITNPDKAIVDPARTPPTTITLSKQAPNTTTHTTSTTIPVPTTPVPTKPITTPATTTIITPEPITTTTNTAPTTTTTIQAPTTTTKSPSSTTTTTTQATTTTTTKPAPTTTTTTPAQTTTTTTLVPTTTITTPSPTITTPTPTPTTTTTTQAPRTTTTTATTTPAPTITTTTLAPTTTTTTLALTTTTSTPAPTTTTTTQTPTTTTTTPAPSTTTTAPVPTSTTTTPVPTPTTTTPVPTTTTTTPAPTTSTTTPAPIATTTTTAPTTTTTTTAPTTTTTTTAPTTTTTTPALTTTTTILAPTTTTTTLALTTTTTTPTPTTTTTTPAPTTTTTTPAPTTTTTTPAPTTTTTTPAPTTKTTTTAPTTITTTPAPTTTTTTLAPTTMTTISTHTTNISGFSPHDCNEKVDVIFLLDVSGSIGTANLIFMKYLIKNFTENIPLGPNTTQIGITTFSTTPSTEFWLNEHYGILTLHQALENIVYKSGGSYIARSLEYVRAYSFAAVNGARQDSKKVLILMTDGISHDNSTTIATTLKNDGVLVACVGIGRHEIDMDELNDIAYNSSYIFSASDIDLLNHIQDIVKSSPCELADNT
ncbi:mucin-2-like [Ylistrum balloti]|uniref:mucin-2-like n=1 Tax=Ylistrum balloti TaxID=509963 RepID=UPI002905A6DF|nr:mucin-2-like [Ylistrum balloti]